MDRKDTRKEQTLPTVLVIGASSELVDRCKQSASAIKLFVETADMANAATMAARSLPMVLVMTRDLYDFDPNEFDALARDVRAKIVRVTDEEVSQVELDTRILAAIAEAKRLRR